MSKVRVSKVRVSKPLSAVKSMCACVYEPKHVLKHVSDGCEKKTVAFAYID